MQSGRSAALLPDRPATTVAMQSASGQQRRLRNIPPASNNSATGALSYSVLLPAYTTHRARCQRDYAVMCSRFPTLTAASAASADARQRRFFPPAASHHGNAEDCNDENEDEAFWPTGFVTSLRPPKFGQQPRTRHHQQQRQSHGRISRGRSLPNFNPDIADDVEENGVDGDFDDAASSSTSSSAETDSVGRLRHRLRLNAWQLCELLRRRGFGDPRQNHRADVSDDNADGLGRQQRRGPRIHQVRFHNHLTSVSGWFARRDLGVGRSVAGASSARPATLGAA